MQIAIYESMRDNQPALIDMPWEDLAETLMSPEASLCSAYTCVGTGCAHKDGEAWSPAIVEGERANDNVRAITAAVFDLDHISVDQLSELADAIEGYRYIVHSTHQYRPGNLRLRLVMELSRNVSPSEWRAVRDSAIARFQIPADKSTKDLSRLYFFPRYPHDVTPIAERGEGRALSVDELIASAPRTSPVIPYRAPESPEGASTVEEFAALPDDGAIDLGTLRERIRTVRNRKSRSADPIERERCEILRRILESAPLAVEGERDNTINQAASILACAFPSSTPREVFLEILRPSLSKMETAPEGLDHWIDRALYSYDRASARRLERDTERREREQRSRETYKALAHRIGTTPAIQGPRLEPASDADDPEDDTDDLFATDPATQQPRWHNLLIYKPDGETLKNVAENAFIILSCDERARGTIRFNDLEKTIEVVGGDFAATSLDVLDVTVTDWLCRHWGLTLDKITVGDRILRVARDNTFDPLRDYLRGIVWDGIPRIDRFLFDYIEARTTAAGGGDISEHLRRIGRRWLISAVARGLAPGCQVDTTIIAEGLEGLRKTSLFRALAGRFFTETSLALGDKDSQMLTASNWIIELSELSSFQKTSSSEVLFGYLTRRIDKFRAPYARVVSAAPRRCVFVGTTNKKNYLTAAINRRFWPFWCEKIHYEKIESDRDQLWAEAVAAFDAGEKWHLTDAEQNEAAEIVAERVDESPREALILTWWCQTPPSKRPAFLTTTEIAMGALGFTKDKINRSVQTEIGLAMQALKFDHKRRRVGGVLQWIYIPTAQHVALPHGKPQPLQLVTDEMEKTK